MCTMIAEQVPVNGSAKSANKWFAVTQANVIYDHPFNAPLEHALCIDFVDESLGLDGRVSVELDVNSARALVEKIESVLEQASVQGHL